MKTRMNNLAVFVVILSVVAATSTPASAKTWDGGASTTNWVDANNWNTDGVPGSGDSAQIGYAPNAGTYTVVLGDGSTQAASNLQTTSGADLTVSGSSTLNVSNLWISEGNTDTSFTIDGGTVNHSGAGNYAWFARDGGLATVDVKNGGRLNTGTTGPYGVVTFGGSTYYGNYGSDGRAAITVDSTSQINFVRGVRFWGYDSSFTGNVDTPATYAEYVLPLSTSTATDGKVSVQNNSSIEVATAPNGTSKVNLRINQGPGAATSLSIGYLTIGGGNSTNRGMMTIDGVDTTVQGFFLDGNGDTTNKLTVKNATITHTGGHDFHLAQSSNSGTVTLDLQSSIVNVGASGGYNRLAIGGQPYANAAYTGNQAVINIDSNSQLNARSIWIGGTATAGGLKTYELPLYHTATNGKMSLTESLTIAGNASGNASKIEVKLSPATGAASSITGLTGGLNIAGSSLSGTDGRLTLDGSSMSFNGRMTLATGTNSSGTISIKDATLMVYAANPSYNDWQYIGGAAYYNAGNGAVGRVILDNGVLESGGDSSNDAIVVRGLGGAAHGNSSGYIQGTGTVRATNATGYFQNNGQVIADGGLLTIDTPNLTTAVDAAGAPNQYGNYLVTMSDGNQAGWYAINQGKLVLPTLNVGAGDPTAIQWGETVGDTSLDLVNSVQVDFGSGTTAGTLDIALLAMDNPSVPAGLSNGMAVFDFNAGGGLIFGSVDIDIRYDDDFWVNTLGLAENDTDMNLFHYTDGSWVDLGATVDSVNHIISATGVTSFSMFGIAQSAASAASTPEPTTAVLALLGLLGLLLGRSRNRRCVRS